MGVKIARNLCEKYPAGYNAPSRHVLFRTPMKPANYPLEPAHLWSHFYQFTRIPRPSGQEAAVRQYLVDLADKAGYSHRQDEAGNLVIRVPGSAGREDRPTVIIQNHLDMVTVKTADRAHDFTTDPLQLRIEDGWLSADRTTLGADNGLGCAAAIALMTDPDVVHPPLELLFTVDEETGLGGALYLDASLLSGTLMLNLDTEDWNELYIGCAGGGGWHFARSFSEDPVAAELACWRLTLRGLAGGHSGVQIHEQLSNAIKLLGECLRDVPGLRLASVDAGVAHNVIPREGVVEFAVPAGTGELLAEKLEALRQQWLAYVPGADAGIELSLETAVLERALDEVDSLRVLDLIAAWPHGAQAYSLQQPADLVDLSINLAVLNFLPIPGLDGGHLMFFFIEAAIRRPINIRMREIAQQAGIFVLILLMIFVFYNDIMRIFSS